MKTSTSDSVLRLLRARQRREMFLLPCLIVIAGFAAALGIALWFWPGEGLTRTAVELWAAVIVASLALGGTVCLRRRRELKRVAREADREFHDRNRLEAAAELAGSNTPLAAAQHAEAAAYFESHPAVRGGAWLSVAAAILLPLTLIHVAILGIWMTKLVRVGWATPDEETATEQTAEFVPSATIRWITPDPEIKATPIEAVPLTAEAQSETGLRGFSLELAVNGTPAKSVPVADLPKTAPGASTIDLEMYLDELEIEPFDMVSYYLKASRISPQELRPTASELQFVQIRPYRDDAYERPGGLGYAEQSFHLLIKLKLAQLGLIKQNFLLAHTELGRETETWRAENERVGGEQALLADKTEDVIEFMITENVTVEVLNLLKQSQPEMRRAGEMILEARNEPATEPQGRALALITECEKLLIKIFMKGKSVGDPGKGPPKDPFEDDQKFELSNRLETPAGELEVIATKQAEILDDIPAGPSDGQTLPGESEGSGSGGELMKQQEEIEKRIAALSGKGALPPEAREALEKAKEAAAEAGERLAAGDREGALEPSARALQRLQEAVTAVNEAGERTAAEAFAKAQRELNDAAGEARAAEGGQGNERAEMAAQGLAAVREALRREAERQQQSGSTDAAQRMANLAKKTADRELREKLRALAEGTEQGNREEGPAESPGQGEGQGEGQGQGGGSQTASARLTELAREAGRESLASMPRQEALATVAESIERAQATLKRLGGRGGGMGGTAGEAIEDLAAAAQQAETLVTGQTVENDVANILRDTHRPAALRPVSVAVLIQSLERPASNLLALLHAAIAEGGRERVIVLVNPEDAPTGYRDSVADYFERLSKDYEAEEAPRP